MFHFQSCSFRKILNIHINPSLDNKRQFFSDTAASQTTDGDGGGGKWKNSEKKMKGSSSSGTRKKSSDGKMFNGESCQRIFCKRKLFPWELMEERKGSQHDCSP